ncbi:transposase IS66 [Thermoanaerobacterium thermosaccharolyticum]|uniref:Transposase IS66 n=1 Tax=Thermoanaerobacterium thermosaccharolyticum TaxID=1517 RepID=A0A223I0S6_THETR|nr:transposase IS66 [Thermoanaerobacterium thermosaccharolyticum]
MGCWAHARRKFDEALKAIPGTSEGVASVAKEGLDYCNKLFGIERELRDVTPKERYEERLK